MPTSTRRAIFHFAVVFTLAACFTSLANAQGSSGTIEGVVKDQTGAVVPNAKVEISYPVSGYRRETTSGPQGEFRFANVPFNPYHLTATATGFAPFVTDVDVRSAVPVPVAIGLSVTSSSTVTVEGDAKDLIENEPGFHTDIDRGLFDRLPLQSQSSQVSSLVTLASPGVVADSNGLFHGLGDHAENSFSVDGQPISDQQSKVFSNQIPADSIQSLEVIAGAPPAEYGDKTSLVIKVTTRSGLGQKTPSGSFTTSYGSFGSTTANFDLAYGGDKWGNFVSLGGLNTGRFLDPPEFQVIHAKGNEQNLFDHVDLQVTGADSLHFNVGYSRSWFQTPNSFDAAAAGQDQRVKIESFNFAPSWTHLFSPSTLLNVVTYVRRDAFNYYPSADPLADLTETATQRRTLLNTGIRADLSHVKGIHNLKVGASFNHTFLNEFFSTGITDAGVNSPCLTTNAAGDFVGAADPSLTDPSQCAGAGFEQNVEANPNASAPFVPLLGCIDLTRPAPAIADGCATPNSAQFLFNGHTDIKQLALYVQDTISVGHWSFNLGVRGDIYRGLSSAAQIQPRVGVAYNIARTNTVLRASYARIMETPFNENLIIASSNDPVTDALFGAGSGVTIAAGQRNEFHAGFQQALGKFLVIDADYLWKYTHNAYDFGDFLSTPIFFPIAWHNSKIDGASVRVSLPNYHGLSAFVMMGHVNSRFFGPQVGGLGTDLGAGGSVFRIDHDQAFQQTTHLQYQPRKNWPWLAFNWRYDSGLVAGAVPFAVDTTTPVDLTVLTADQQMQAGLFCGNVFPTLTAPLITCAPSQYGSTLMKLPAPGTENDDHNPPRVASRHLFDVSVGDDNLFRGDRYKWSLRATVINLTDQKALYNFLSTFSGTHYVTPRSMNLEVGFHF
ncbi:MAG: TonB-dependent receptor [Acidobacteriota bacterium]|nr:TonB-dependent receptor [Acidobacteriota bacterium]